MGIALSKLAQEDPSFRVFTDHESGQTIISGMGELHLDIIEIDITNRTLTLRLEEEEIQDRLSKLPEFEMKVRTGYLARYARFVSSADKGAVFPR